MRGSRSLLLRCFAPMMVLLLSIACLAVQGGAALAAPGTPTLVEPGFGRVDVVLNPTLKASAYTGSNAHKATEWQLDDWHDQDLWTNPEWTRTSVAAETSTVVNAASGTFASALAGRTSLDPNETYFWRVRYQDSDGHLERVVGVLALRHRHFHLVPGRRVDGRRHGDLGAGAEPRRRERRCGRGVHDRQRRGQAGRAAEPDHRPQQPHLLKRRDLRHQLQRLDQGGRGRPVPSSASGPCTATAGNGDTTPSGSPRLLPPGTWPKGLRTEAWRPGCWCRTPTPARSAWT